MFSQLSTKKKMITYLLGSGGVNGCPVGAYTAYPNPSAYLLTHPANPTSQIEAARSLTQKHASPHTARPREPGGLHGTFRAAFLYHDHH